MPQIFTIVLDVRVEDGTDQFDLDEKIRKALEELGTVIRVRSYLTEVEVIKNAERQR